MAVRVEEELTENTTDAMKGLETLRSKVNSLGGSLIVENAPLSIKEKFDSWGHVGKASSLMRRIKDQLDPNEIFSPGRFVAGI